MNLRLVSSISWMLLAMMLPSAQSKLRGESVNRAILQDDAAIYKKAKRHLSWNDGPQTTTFSTSFPLAHCQGDCDVDDDCEGDLVCDDSREQGVPKPVPGCSILPTEDSGTDFCVYLADLNAVDEGNGSDIDNEENEDNDGSENKDGADGGGDDEDVLDYNDTSGGPLVFVADDPDERDSRNRLGLCEGDCDSDYTCGQGLMCWHRVGLDENVPGCESGGPGDIPTKDYCVLEKYRGTDGDQFYFSDDASFRLKLYWEPGYHWQEETFERRWCIECVDKPCTSGSRIFISECSLARNELLEFASVDDEHVQVRWAAGGKCWTRVDNAMSWEDCDSGDTNQHWYADNGSFTSSKFEIKARGIDDKCVTQGHHPKDVEWLGLEDCAKAHRDETAFWTKY